MDTREVEIFFKKEGATEKSTLIKKYFHTSITLCRKINTELVCIFHDTNQK